MNKSPMRPSFYVHFLPGAPDGHMRNEWDESCPTCLPCPEPSWLTWTSQECCVVLCFVTCTPKLSNYVIFWNSFVISSLEYSVLQSTLAFPRHLLFCCPCVSSPVFLCCLYVSSLVLLCCSVMSSAVPRFATWCHLLATWIVLACNILYSCIVLFSDVYMYSLYDER